MAFDFTFPDVGEGITEGEIVQWRVKEGDTVKQDQVIVNVETDKAVVEIPSPKSGNILKIHHKAGDTVKVGEVLVTIGAAGEKVTVPQPKVVVQKKEEPVNQRKSVGVVGDLEEAPDETPQKPQPGSVKEARQQPAATHALATPATRRLARELHVNIESVTGTGMGNRVTEEDVRKVAEGQTRQEKKTEVGHVRKYDFWGYVEHVPLKGMRKAIARHMVESYATIPHVTHMDEADVTHLVAIREKEKKKAEKQGIKLTYLPFIIKAVIAALQNHPYMRATVDEEHEDITIRKYYNLGFAVDTGNGLVVPVIKGADMKSIQEIAQEIAALAAKAKARKLDIADMKGGVFTITNIGSIGGQYATPIINSPESAILGLGRTYQKPVVVDGKVKVRWVLPLSLSFDHRVTDGAEAARFVNEIKEFLEDPDELLLEL